MTHTRKEARGEWGKEAAPEYQQVSFFFFIFSCGSPFSECAKWHCRRAEKQQCMRAKAGALPLRGIAHRLISGGLPNLFPSRKTRLSTSRRAGLALLSSFFFAVDFLFLVRAPANRMRAPPFAPVPPPSSFGRREEIRLTLKYRFLFDLFSFLSGRLILCSLGRWV